MVGGRREKERQRQRLQMHFGNPFEPALPCFAPSVSQSVAWLAGWRYLLPASPQGRAGTLFFLLCRGFRCPAFCGPMAARVAIWWGWGWLPARTLPAGGRCCMINSVYGVRVQERNAGVENAASAAMATPYGAARCSMALLDYGYHTGWPLQLLHRTEKSWITPNLRDISWTCYGGKPVCCANLIPGPSHGKPIGLVSAGKHPHSACRACDMSNLASRRL
jgi:hypothetical protein